MKRRLLVHWSLVLCLIWQGISFAHAGASMPASADATHELMHAQMLPHHHDASGAIDFDDSAASLLHVMADLSGSSLPRPDVLLAMPRSIGAAPSVLAERAPPNAFLEGPLRPPRSLP